MTDDVPDLLERWAHGWARARELAVRVVEPGLRIDVNATSRRAEFVLPRPTAERVAVLARQIAGQPDVWVTLDAGAARRLPDSTANLEVLSTVEALMTRPLEAEAARDDVVLDVHGTRAHAHIRVDGETAAAGVASVDDTDVVFDRIGTGPSFRRRGLGSSIMRALSGWAFERGATTGILAASADGQRLYRRLGWTVVCPLVTFRGGASGAGR